MVGTVGSFALSVQERESFLAEPHVAALSVDAGPDRAPLTVPIWYHYAPGGEIWILTPAGSRRTELIAAAGRVSFIVDRVEPTARYGRRSAPSGTEREADPALSSVIAVEEHAARQSPLWVPKR